jgi:type II secretory pathway pseudopilin PulG
LAACLTARSSFASRECGFTYLGILIALALVSLSLAAAGTVWSVQKQRQREQQLLWVGQQFRDAIARYHSATPLNLHQYPRALEELVEDRRGPAVRRHLRRIYADPLTGAMDWDLVRTPEGAIIGVASLSMDTPRKRAHFDEVDAAFEGARCYCDWRFVYLPGLQGVANAVR